MSPLMGVVFGMRNQLEEIMVYFLLYLSFIPLFLLLSFLDLVDNAPKRGIRIN
jgi:hypothetical protein